MYWYPHATLSQKNDKYGFVNENEVRIATGMTLVMWLFSLFLVLFRAEYEIPLVLTIIMVADFVLKVLFGPRFALFGSFVRLFLDRKKAVRVWALQKRFAWSIGIFLSAFVLYCLLILSWHMAPAAWPQTEAVQSIRAMTQTNIAAGKLIVAPMNPAIIACVLCIVFMWFESVAGYCVGCAMYRWFVKKWWFKKHPNQNCVGDVCKID